MQSDQKTRHGLLAFLCVLSTSVLGEETSSYSDAEKQPAQGRALLSPPTQLQQGGLGC